MAAILLVACALIVPAMSARAQESGGTAQDEIHPLASKEEMIRDRFERFEDRVFRLREQLGNKEPENAARLARVLQRAGELGLSDRLNKLVEMLGDPSSLTEATDAQAGWLADADRLLAVLLERDSENQERRDEIDRLQEYNDKLAEILAKERALRDAAAAAGFAKRMGALLDQAIQRLDAMLDRQAKIAQQTGQNKPESAPNAPEDSLGERQADLSQDAEQLAEDLERLSRMKPEESADTQKLQEARSQTQAAGESTRQGAGDMAEASKELQTNAKPQALERQEEATEALKEARQRLEEAKSKLEELQNDQETADQQEQVAQETGGLSEKMQQDSQAGDPQESDQSKSAPGQQNLDQAKSEMDKASQSLKSSQPNEAIPSQDRAIERLKKAQKELEEALRQLRQEEREEILRDLEGRFREMAFKQRAINETTVQLDGVGDFQRAHRLQLADLSARQDALAQDADACLHILDEDGTTVVFPRVMEQIGEDMTTVAGWLTDARVGALTQTVEREIVDTLEQLLQAVQLMQQENEQNAGQGGGGGGDEQDPLLPESAELKLLRASQFRVNERTVVIESAIAKEDDSSSVFQRSLRTVAERQAQCAEIAGQMRDRQRRP